MSYDTWCYMASHKVRCNEHDTTTLMSYKKTCLVKNLSGELELANSKSYDAWIWQASIQSSS